MRAGVKRELGWIAAGAGLLGLLAGRRAFGLAAAAGGAILLLEGRGRAETFRGHSALVTGGSRGLGLALAIALAREGARVAILARDGEELARARARILSEVPGAEVNPFVCDLTRPDSIPAVIREVAARQGGLDLLVNNAGAITIGPFETMDRADFDAQLELHFHAVRETCRQALPFLRESPHRRIVNIVSMGGKAGVPHMLPYDVSKFALAGFSQGLAAELAPEGVSVTAVYPAVMRTGSPAQAVFKGDHEKEFAWFVAGDVLPLLSLDAAVAARKILRAARRRDAELVPSAAGRLRNLAAAIFPETVAAVMGVAAGRMPSGESHVHRTGYESRGLVERSWLFAPVRALARRYERRWNQQPRTDAAFNMSLRPRGRMVG